MRLLPFCAFLLIVTGLVLSEEEGENTEPDHQPTVEEPHISVEPALVIEDVPDIKSPEFLETQTNIDEDADDEGGDDILLPLHGGPLNRDRGLPGSFGPHGPNQGRKHHRHHHHRLWNHHHNYHHYFPHHNHTDCCLTKKVGEHHYHLADGFCGKARDFDCSSDCCYTRENYDKERWFCFKDNEEGLLVSDCVKDHYSHEFHSSESSSEEGGVLLMGGVVNGSLSGNVELMGDCDAVIKDLSEAGNNAAAAIKDGSVFHCGGDTDSGKSNRCYIREESGVWTRGPSMNTARGFFTLNSVGSKLVAIGGYNGGSLDTVEFLESSVWQVAGFKINPGRDDHCAVTISDSSVLLVGGWDGWNQLKTTEELNIDSGAVTPYADLPYGIWGHACSLYTGQILVSGGFGEGDRRSVYSLDYRSKGSDWVLLNHMEYGRYWHTMHIVNGVLTVYGGVGDGESTLEELVDSSWDAKPMKNRRRQQSSVVLC